MTNDKRDLFIQKIKDLASQKPVTLKVAVAQEALDHDDIICFFQDLLKHGCVSGMVTSLIYYSDTHKFFDMHYHEIEELRQEYEETTGCIIDVKNNDLKNTLAWFAFEETAYRLYQKFKDH